MDLSHLGYYGPEWDRKIRDKDKPDFWKYGVANLVFADSVAGRKTILDVGCGTGGLTFFLAEHTQLNCIIGIDPVRSMIKVAEQHASQRGLSSRVHFVICDGRYLPFKHSCFDALVSRGDAFVFLIPQKRALLEFRRTMRNGAIVLIEIDNVLWKPKQTISTGFEEMADNAIAFSVEYFDANRDHFKTFYTLDSQSAIAKKIRRNREFIQTGRLKRRLPLRKILRETIQIRRGVVTHWPTVDELKMLFTDVGFKKMQILGDGLLMELLLEGNQNIKEAMKRQPELFFEIEKRLIPFINPRKAPTIILKAIAHQVLNFV